jgi:mono/diheme cytochrome c family protein
MSLVIINGILSFMLHPGEWPATRNFWHGFFNPQYSPQLIARTGGCLLLTSLYVYFHMAIFCRSEGLRALVAKRSAKPAMVGAVLVAIGSLLFLVALPESARLNLEKAAALNIFMALLFAITVIVFAMFFFGPTRNPQWLTPGFGILFLLFGFAAVSIGEFVREAVRKPYIVYNVVMSNGIMAQEIPDVAARGYLESGPFTSAEVRARHPQVAAGSEINEGALAQLPPSERIHLGQMLFMTHCNQCHAAEKGMSAVGALTTGWNRDMLMSVVEHPNLHQTAMPPWAGTRDEARLLAEYLESIQRGAPGGMYFGEEAE